MNQDLLRGLFYYKNGELFYRITISPKNPVGSKLGFLSERGYKRCKIFRKSYMVHRLIWQFHHGEIPDGKIIDHIDGNPSNNFIENLRLATYSQNRMNSVLLKTNTSGVCGVSFKKKRNKWTAQITVNGKYISLGEFTNKIDAIEERLKAELQYGVYSWYNRTRQNK